MLLLYSKSRCCFEISQRILDAFQGEQIDVLHQQSRQQFNGHFVIATIHQLYRFKIILTLFLLTK